MAAVMSAFLFVFMREEMIWFGILHFLAVSILLFALCRPLLDKIPPAWGVAACAVLTLITWWVPGYRGSQFGIPGGCCPPPYRERAGPAGGCIPWDLGLAREPIISRLLPWLFVFLAGSFLGRWAKEGRFPQFMYVSRAQWLAWLGRHTLVIYVAHQPVLFGLCWLIAAMV